MTTFFLKTVFIPSLPDPKYLPTALYAPSIALYYEENSGLGLIAASPHSTLYDSTELQRGLGSLSTPRIP